MYIYLLVARRLLVIDSLPHLRFFDVIYSKTDFIEDILCINIFRYSKSISESEDSIVTCLDHISCHVLEISLKLIRQ